MLAVVGVVVCFSLGSTLVKRAQTPGVLVAFWRMVTTTIVWNGILFMRGKHLRIADLRQALVPGIFFGLNITCFYAGATHNSVANAELIGSLTPFLVVPIGAKFFKEYINARALFFALIAFGGVAIVLFTAPTTGDASLKGNLLGFTAMVLWATYIATARYFRKEMDVITFMASITPIAIVTVLPLAPSSRVWPLTV
jgi:drug/metabolite transporter (DMT)-like permease